MTSAIVSAIETRGFFECRRSTSPALPALREFVSALRPSAIRVDKLRPREAAAARPNTLSANHGTDRFPPHTDFALRPLPPQYIALFCPISRPGATTLFSTDRLRSAVSEAGTFRITTNGKSYSTSFSNVSRHGKFYRYNSDLMKPLDVGARRLASVIDLAQPDHYVDWKNISWVIFDNWSFLHGRQTLSEATGWLWRLALETHK
jgi:hypothetical protein